MKANVGFSSQQIASGFDTRMSNTALIKMDLENHFNINEGEVRGRPKFGSKIKTFVGRPFTEYVIEEFRDEVEKVVGADPRVELSSGLITSTTDMITFEGSLKFLLSGVEEVINISIDNIGIVRIR